jgi:enoyl-CoA hydratase
MFSRMQTTTTVLTSVHEAVATLTLQRPEKANAYDEALLLALEKAFQDLIADGGVRAIILTGSGDRHFCAGADLDEMRQRPFTDALALRSQSVFDAIAHAPKPTIAAVNGWALGGGMELALACDFRLASTRARFGLPEVGLGIIPAAGGTLRLPRLVGMARAREIILMGRQLDAQEALQAGLVNEVAASPDLLSLAHTWGKQLAARDPLALRLAKEALALASGADEPVLRMEGLAQALLYHQRSLD